MSVLDEELMMIGKANIDKLFDFIRRKDWASAHALLDQIASTDSDLHGIAHWRSVVLGDEGRYDEALSYLAENRRRFNCQTNVNQKRAWIYHLMGNDDAALEEIENAPFNSEIEEFWALVMEAKFFRLYLMARAGRPITQEEWADIPDDYVALLPTGERIPKGKLVRVAKRQS